MNQVFRLGLSGGIGSGKTTVTDLFAAKGVPVIDADSIAREVVRAGHAAFSAIVERFGDEVIGKDGELRRQHLRQLVFEDASLRRQLEAIVHPHVHAEIVRRLNETRFPYCIISSPLLLESRSLYDLDRIAIVDLPESMQLERASKRDKVSKEEIKQIMNAQISREKRLQAADDIILNDQDISYLQKQVETLHQKYLDFAAQKIKQCV